MPDDLAAQIAPIHEGVAALGGPVLSCVGGEADDVAGGEPGDARGDDLRSRPARRGDAEHEARSRDDSIVRPEDRGAQPARSETEMGLGVKLLTDRPVRCASPLAAIAAGFRHDALIGAAPAKNARKGS